MEKLEEKAIKEELKAIKEVAKEGNVIEFYDITLAIIADEEEIDTISEISSKLKFRVFIPENLLKDGRTFFMYRYHDGKVEKLTGEVDSEVVFDEVLYVDGKVGTPTVKGAKVVAKVLKHGKQKKVLVFKYKPKKKYRKTQGHRQPYTKILIKSINK